MGRPGLRLAALLAAAVAAAAAAPAAGQQRSIRLNGERSQAEFRVQLLWLMPLRGQFGSLRGEIDVDPAGRQAQVKAAADVEHVRMSARIYEDWIKSAEFFDSAAHPAIEFTSSRFALANLRDGGQLRGTLTIRGVRRELEFEIRPADCEQPGTDCPIRLRTTLRRSAFGMRSRLGTLGDRVRLRLRIFLDVPLALDPRP